MLEKIKKFWREHRTASIIILIIIILIAYFSYQKLKSNATPTSYILGTVVKDTLVTTVSGTGQVTNSNQVDLKSKVSSQVTALNIESGQSVLAQTVLIQFDAENARKAVRDASANLDSAKLALTKIQQPADQLSLIQS
ncbi:MAG: hypothetical protein NTV81_03995, partial [Candidatus Komeilibacteria bacterium]|nr:hypothetical protein [Candidatus Komeilibacteria bacterium]